MKTLLVALAALALATPTLSRAAEAPEATAPPSEAPQPPTLESCAAAYGALARQQTTFGAADSLFGERFPGYAKIDFEGRLAELSHKTEKGVTELKAMGEEYPIQFYLKLVDAETEGEIDTPDVTELARVENACDAAYAFAPSLGG